METEFMLISLDFHIRQPSAVTFYSFCCQRSFVSEQCDNTCNLGNINLMLAYMLDSRGINDVLENQNFLFNAFGTILSADKNNKSLECTRYQSKCYIYKQIQQTHTNTLFNFYDNSIRQPLLFYYMDEQTESQRKPKSHSQ